MARIVFYNLVEFLEEVRCRGIKTIRRDYVPRQFDDGIWVLDLVLTATDGEDVLYMRLFVRWFVPGPRGEHHAIIEEAKEKTDEWLVKKLKDFDVMAGGVIEAV